MKRIHAENRGPAANAPGMNPFRQAAGRVLTRSLSQRARAGCDVRLCREGQPAATRCDGPIRGELTGSTPQLPDHEVRTVHPYVIEELARQRQRELRVAAEQYARLGPAARLGLA